MVYYFIVVVVVALLQAVKLDACRSINTRVKAMMEASVEGGVALPQHGDTMVKLFPARVSLSVSTCAHFKLSEYIHPHEELQVPVTCGICHGHQPVCVFTNSY